MQIQRLATVLLVGLLFTNGIACGGSSEVKSAQGENCQKTADCVKGLGCVNFTCRVRSDATTGEDASIQDVAGDLDASSEDALADVLDDIQDLAGDVDLSPQDLVGDLARDVDLPPQDLVGDLLIDIEDTGAPDDLSPADSSVEPALNCETYCGYMKANCTGANAQYENHANCLAVCANFMPGDKGTSVTASGEDTLGCRIYYSNAPAANDPATHCTYAGPGGDGTCGTNCASFCALNGAICGFGSDGTNQFEDLAACLLVCKVMASTDAYNSADHSSDSNELSCYLYHLTAAAEDPVTHCPHTNPQYNGPCGKAL